MFLQDKRTGALLKVLDTTELINPVEETIRCRIQEGQEEQEPEKFGKANLVFPSGETLPRCWVDADYRTTT
ncbi:MAG: acetyltransferase [Cyanobacteria bacterium CRU_2_1]|nr:acetyltransferase [Cyanobacteria bacterium RU_5_0]NJR60964.1 acetyltransferase [Cyanobacteria bacterium CRU_2_1]